ncbi:MAG: GC-type dockerin domain-anchored protein [Planctomycetota bacterium]
MSRDRAWLAGALVCCVFAGWAGAQSFNIEWGSPESSPPETYPGVGLPGVWNTIDAMPKFQRIPLVGLDGLPIAADIMNIGFDVVESFENPATSGGDAALLDDCITSFNNPIDGCLFIRFVDPGEYRVIMYGIAPDDVSLLSRLRIDQNTEPPIMVGGAWPGSHEEGVTYMSQTATVGADGRLDMHSGLPSGNVRSVLNGIQVIRLDEACRADFAEPFGLLNFFDISAFIGAYQAGDPAADLAEPFGAFNFFDVSAYIGLFNAGCP